MFYRVLSKVYTPWHVINLSSESKKLGERINGKTFGESFCGFKFNFKGLHNFCAIPSSTYQENHGLLILTRQNILNDFSSKNETALGIGVRTPGAGQNLPFSHFAFEFHNKHNDKTLLQNLNLRIFVKLLACLNSTFF